MSRRRSKYITIPVSLWENKDLTWQEKIVLMEIDSQAAEDDTYRKSLGRIASSLDMPRHVVEGVYASLLKKGAITVKMALNGDNVVVTYTDKRRYLSDGEEEPDTAEKPKDNIDYAMVLSEWKRTNPSLQQPRMFTPKMQQQLRTLLKNNKSSIEELVKVFEAVACSSFLNGKVGKGEWKASLHWLIKDSNNSYQRIINGDFHHGETERYLLDGIFSGVVAQQTETKYR